MKLGNAGVEHNSFLDSAGMLARAARWGVLAGESALSVDGLDAAIRGISVAAVFLLSLAVFGSGGSATPTGQIEPLAIAGALIVYNALVIALAGVPWRRPPNFSLFVLDWLVATTAILLTGGFFSPFLILYYALAIGAALRVGLRRSLILVTGCALVYVILSVTHSQPAQAIQLPILVVEITSLVMVAGTTVGMKQVVIAEARRVALEEQSARQFRLLNNLTNLVLSASPDLEKVMRTLASMSSQALDADAGLAVLCEMPATPTPSANLSDCEGLLLVSDRYPNPVALSEREAAMLHEAMLKRTPVLYSEIAPRAFPGLDSAGRAISTVACAPFLLNNAVIGALFVGRVEGQPFSEAQINLLTAIGQQMAVAVRLARLYEMEREKAQRSEERERLERDLLSMVSHELRTPLTAIKTCVDALSAVEQQAGERAPTEKRLLDNIDRSTERLINLVNELLDMARLRAGRVSLNLQQLNLGEVIQESAAQVKPLLDARNQTLLLDLPACKSPRWNKLTALADRRRIEQVLLNLLSNANKYGPDSGVITLGATPRSGRIKVFVKDQGPGIEAYQQSRVFERFYQVAGRDRQPDGTGLGLAIARSIVELHGGQIGVHSRPNQGSTFYFTLAQAQETL